jgi:hypothetical protein
LTLNLSQFRARLSRSREMSAGQGRAKHGGESRSWAVRLLVCVVLVAFLAVVQLPHLHATQNDADHCPLCVVMHSAAPATVAEVAVVMVPVGAPAPQIVPETVPQKRQTRLFIRPPPSGC